MLGLVLTALVLAYAYPVRTYLNQQAQIASLEQSQQAQRQRIVALNEQQAKLQDPAYIAALSQSRLQYVKPGDTLYIVSGGLTPVTGTGTTAGRAKDTGPWYGQLWSSIHAADQPPPAGAGG